MFILTLRKAKVNKVFKQFCSEQATTGHAKIRKYPNSYKTIRVKELISHLNHDLSEVPFILVVEHRTCCLTEFEKQMETPTTKITIKHQRMKGHLDPYSFNTKKFCVIIMIVVHATYMSV